MNPIRLFGCEMCRHRLRFGATRCGNCGHVAPFYNRFAIWFWLAALVVAMLVALNLG